MATHRRYAYPDLKTFLRKTGTTQHALAKRIGVEASHVSKILSGRRLPSGPVAIKIVRMAKIPLESLFRHPASGL